MPIVFWASLAPWPKDTAAADTSCRPLNAPGGTPEKVSTFAALLMGPDDAFMTGSDILTDGSVTASGRFGDLGPPEPRWRSSRQTGTSRDSPLTVLVDGAAGIIGSVAAAEIADCRRSDPHVRNLARARWVSGRRRVVVGDDLGSIHSCGGVPSPDRGESPGRSASLTLMLTI